MQPFQEPVSLDHKTNFKIKMMQRVKLMIGLMLVSTALFAQEDNREIQTLFGDKSGFGGYLGINSKLGEVNDQDALFVGGELAFALNRSFNIGVEGYGMVNHVLSNDLSDDGERLYVQMGYGGLHIEPVLNSEGLLHVTLPVLLGAGGIGHTERPYWEEHDGEVYVDFDSHFQETDYFFMAEPGVNLELNLFKFMRLAGGASYRFTSDVELGSMEMKDLNGWNANLSLRIGWF